MIQRTIQSKIIELSKLFPVVTVTGARQTGKTTLLKLLFKELPYVNLEDLDNRLIAQEDPRGFLHNYTNGAVLDEVQQVPALFSYIQQLVDHSGARFILSGSQNFQLIQSITQSLAGRVAILNLPPFSYAELQQGGFHFKTVEDFLFKGGYPRIYDQQIPAVDFFSNYITTYVERDVRQVLNIQNVNSFSKFLKMCAGRIGQLINYQSLSNDVGVSPNTIKSWISILETSFILFQLHPHHKNFNKRLTKSSKLYFNDTGLACSLLQIESPDQLSSHYLRGGLFENMVINEMRKFYINQGKKPNLYFWQDKSKKEIDVLLEKGAKLFPFEIKSTQTKSLSLLDNFNYWNKINPTEATYLNLVYAGEDNLAGNNGNFISWKNIYSVLEELG